MAAKINVREQGLTVLHQAAHPKIEYVPLGCHYHRIPSAND